MSFKTLAQQNLSELKNRGLIRRLKQSHGVSFVHNDYLNLSQHPAIVEAGIDALSVSGAGPRGSRLLGGHSQHIEATEQAIAEFFDAPTALMFSSGFMANLGLLGALGKLTNRVYSDALNHASLVDGMRLGRFEKTIIPHRAWNEANIASSSIMVSESCFSMDGDLLRWTELNSVAKQSESFLVIDEAHAAGVFRETGQGYVPRSEIDWDRTAVVVTFGKAFGVAGAAVMGAEWLRELILNHARSFIYTTAPLSASVAMIKRSLGVVVEEKWRREELWKRAENVREIFSQVASVAGQTMTSTRTEMWERRSPIIPVFLSGEKAVSELSSKMAEVGIEVWPIRYPTVAKGSERIRLSLNLAVSEDNTYAMAEWIGKKWTEYLSQGLTPT